MVILESIKRQTTFQTMDTGVHVPDSWNIHELPPLTLINIITWFSSFMMIVGGVIPFIPQYRDIRRSQNAEGFSTFVCLTLLIANILRIEFWFGKHYELPLLAQSIIMTFAMMAMVHLCVQVKLKTDMAASSKGHKFSDSSGHHTSVSLPVDITTNAFTDFDINHFWKWTYFNSYVQCMVAFTIVVTALTYLFNNFSIYVECIGFLAVFSEAMLGSPQFYRNFKNKSTMGMSIKMVLMWTCGDIFKTCYFLLREAPTQFWLCGSLQVGIDIAILSQVFYYKC